jgi:hypothetical protein
MFMKMHYHAELTYIDRLWNNACVEMAIADFFHAQNIPDAVVKSPEFKRLVRQCRLIDSTFVIPLT